MVNMDKLDKENTLTPSENGSNSESDQQEQETPKRRPKTPSVLENRAFQPPRLDALQKATQYRLCMAKKPKSVSPKVTVKRRKKNLDGNSDSESDSELLHMNFIHNKADDGPGYFDPCEDYDFDCEELSFADHQEDTEKPSQALYSIIDINNTYITFESSQICFSEKWVEKKKCEEHSFADHQEDTEKPSQALYSTVCKGLHVTPSSMVYRSLPGAEVVLCHHLLGDRGTRAIATALVDNLTVKRLHLQDNDVRPQGSKYIADMLMENLSISELTLSENSVGSEGLKALMMVLETNENIHKLDISGNNFDENDAVVIANMLEENTIIRDLNLSHNKFREKGGEIIGHALGCNDAVEVVDLSWNHLRRAGAVAVADALLRNISIISLNVSWNGFYLDGCRALMSALRSNKILEKLDLTCNRIDFECVQQLIKGINGNTTVTSLNLSSNPLTSDGAYLLMKTIHDNEAVKINYLDIHTQGIDVNFLKLYEIVRDRQEIRVWHGVIIDQHIPGGEGDSEFNHEDPMMVLMELMRVMHFRLVDLFSVLDRDQSRSLSSEELKNGLMSVHVPITEKSVDRLVRKLDTDGDGEVDFGELMEGQKLHTAKLRRLKQLESDLPFQETELGRIHMKLKHLMNTGQAEAIKKMAELREQRSKDRNIALGLGD